MFLLPVELMNNEGTIRADEVTLCMLCRSRGAIVYTGLTDRLFGVPGSWKSRRCEACGLAWIDPMPFVEDIPRLYANYYTHESRNPDELDVRLRRAVLAARFGYSDGGPKGIWLLVGRLASLVGPAREKVESDVMALTPPQGRLLDVGCGNGRFLVKMKSLGWDPHGIEPDREAARIAQISLSSAVHGSFEEADFAADSFDAITMNHVIEHVPDPIATLRECRRILVRGGRLMIVTPNCWALGHRLFRESWLGLDAPRHLYLFSPRTLAASARRAGLAVRRVRTPAAAAYWIWKTGWRLRRGGTLPGGDVEAPSVSLRLGGLGFWAIEHLLSRTNRLGEEVWLLATKD